MSTSPCSGQSGSTSDASRTGQSFGVLVATMASHGIIKSVDAEAARLMPGVLGIWTGADLMAAGCQPVGPAIDLPLGDETPIRLQVRYWLATGRIRYVGEPFALVVAETATEAKAAADAMSVDLVPLPIIPDPRSAAALGALPLFDNAADNLCCDLRRGDYMQTVRAFDEAAHIARLRFIGDRVDDTMMTQHDALTDYVSIQLGRSVELNDDVSAVHLSCAYDFEGELALDSNGHFLALRIRGFVSAGAYLEDMVPIRMASAITCGATSAYSLPLVEISSKVLFTTTPPVNAHSLTDQPEATYFLERLIDQSARDLGIDRRELRKRNANRHHAINLARLIEKACVAADAKGFAERKAASIRNNTLRGLGVGTFCDSVSSASFFGVGIAEVEVDPETGLIKIARRTIVSANGVVSHRSLDTGDRQDLHRIGGPIDAYAKPALANAIVDALGGKHIDVPAMPERVWEALHAPAPMLGLH